jgi:hypothetical protein
MRANSRPAHGGARTNDEVEAINVSLMKEPQSQQARGPFGTLRFACASLELATLSVDDRELITVSEAARRLDTYPNAINCWIAKGEQLEAFRVEGRSFRVVDADQVEAFRVRRVGTPRSSGF